MSNEQLTEQVEMKLLELKPEIDALMGKMRELGLGCLFLYEIDGYNVGEVANDFFFDRSIDSEKHEFLGSVCNAVGI
jgi:hypothetical protein